MNRAYGLIALLCAAGLAAAQAPRTATLKGPLSLQEALDALHAQTGNRVADLRTQKANPKLALPAASGSFWPLLDQIGKASGIGFTAYGPEGVALVDVPYRPLPTTYSGLFRLALKRTTVDLDFETKAHLLHATLDVAWEPHFQPFYLDVTRLATTYAPPGSAVSAAGHGQIWVGGRSATEVELRLPAPPRGCPRIDKLSGSLAVIGPTRMLDFTFDKLAPSVAGEAPRERIQDGVKVTLTRLSATRDRWSIDVRIDNPPGGQALESFQSWLDNNRIALVRHERGKKITWSPDAAEEQQLSPITSRHAHVRYHFPLDAGRRPGTLSDWTLHYRTPARIVQIEAPFEFRDVPLP